MLDAATTREMITCAWALASQKSGVGPVGGETAALGPGRLFLSRCKPGPTLLTLQGQNKTDGAEMGQSCEGPQASLGGRGTDGEEPGAGVLSQQPRMELSSGSGPWAVAVSFLLSVKAGFPRLLIRWKILPWASKAFLAVARTALSPRVPCLLPCLSPCRLTLQSPFLSQSSLSRFQTHLATSLCSLCSVLYWRQEDPGVQLQKER